MNKKLDKIEAIISQIQNYCDDVFDFSFDPKNPVVRLHEPTFGPDEIVANLMPMLETRVTMGNRVRKFEGEYAEKFSYQHCVMNNSGSSANLLALSALTSHLTANPLRAGDEVIVPALSWSTTIWPLSQNGLVPVFVDCDPLTWNIDVDSIRAAIGPKTKAIMLVHVYGNPCNMDHIMSLAEEYKLQVIEDSCESMGAFYKGKAVGSFGRVGTFSLYFSHHITSLEGGLSVTDDFDLSEVMRIQRAHGWSREAQNSKIYEEQYPEIDPRFIFIDRGYNLRPTECQAAMGTVQLPKLDNIVATRSHNANFLKNALSKYNGVFQMQVETEAATSSWFGVGFVLKDPSKFSVKEITQHLNSKKIETRPIIAGNMTKHPAMQHVNHRINGTLNNSTKIMDNGFAIGCHQALNNDALDYIIGAFDDFFKEKNY